MTIMFPVRDPTVKGNVVEVLKYPLIVAPPLSGGVAFPVKEIAAAMETCVPDDHVTTKLLAPVAGNVRRNRNIEPV